MRDWMADGGRSATCADRRRGITHVLPVSTVNFHSRIRLQVSLPLAVTHFIKGMSSLPGWGTEIREYGRRRLYRGGFDWVGGFGAPFAG